MLTLFCFFLLWMGCGEPTPSDKNVAISAPDAIPAALNDASIRILPGVDVLPENGTTVRIYFSEPIELGGQKIQITTLDGEKMEGKLGRWVWNEARTIVRLEPKHLEAGTKIAVVVRALASESGAVIAPFSKTFTIVPADTTPPSGAHLVARLMDTTDAGKELEVVFSEPIRSESLGALSVLQEGVRCRGCGDSDPTKRAPISLQNSRLQHRACTLTTAQESMT